MRSETVTVGVINCINIINFSFRNLKLEDSKSSLADWGLAGVLLSRFFDDLSAVF